MKATFAGLSAEMPDGWVDSSTIVYVMPPPAGLDAPLAKQKRSGAGNASVSVTWEDASGTTSEYLNARLEQLAKVIPGFVLQARGELEGQSDAPWAEYTLDTGQALRQLLVVRQVGKRFVVVTGTALDATFASVRDKLVTAARTVAEE